MKQRLLTILLTIMPLLANAEAVEINGIYYNLVGKSMQAEVTSNPNRYSGEVVIPATVEYEGSTYSVTSIGTGAFTDCDNMTSITIPNSITTIGEEAFYLCKGLRSIDIPNNVTSIKRLTFYGCSGLTSVTIPNSVTSIGEFAFYMCSSISSITIPNSVSIIENHVFSGCTGLSSVTIPDNLTKISSEVFSNCSELISVTIPNGVTSIDVRAFSGCKKLTSFTVPNSVTYIGIEAFKNCVGLTTVTIGNGIKNIGKHAFASCQNISDVYCSAEDVPSTASDAFEGSYPESTTLHVVASAINSYKATAPWSSFKDIVDLNSGGSGNNDTPPSGTFEIGGIYYNLVGKSMQAEVISNPNRYSGEVVIPATVEYEGSTYSVTSIGTGAFTDCDNMTSITIPNSITTIGEEAFYLCKGLRSIDIPNNVTSIKRLTFYGCSGLTSVTIPNSVTSIGEFAFYMCSSISSITIPNSVSIIENHVFSGCTGLSSVTIPDNLTKISSEVFSNCSELISVTIPNGVTSIDVRAFSGCKKLTSFTVPNSVTYIGIEAFKNCVGLTTVTIGNGIKNIGKHAFASCQNISDVYCSAEDVPSTASDAFEGSYPESTTLHVVASAINSYKATAPWSSFKEILKIGKSEYNLTYIVDGEVYKTYTIEEGEAISPEAVPTKEGYTFSGWSEIPQTMPDHDVTVTGTFSINKYKLTYVVDGVEYKSFEIELGSAITPEAEPTKEGYTFSGWSEIPQTMPDHDVTVTGSFTVNKYKLTYMVDGAEYKSYEVEYGSTITPEAAPTKEGYIFSGWSNLPSTMPARDVTVTGSFTKGAYTLTYIVDGETYKTVGYDFGETITPEAEPSVEGYTFSGWSEIPQTMPDHNVTVTGSFSINTYTLTYMVDGEVYKSFDLEYGAKITPEAEPTKNGYTFSGWSEIPKTMPAHDVTVTGNFTSDATQYNLTITASGNGSVSYNGNAIKNRTRTFSLDEGSNATLTFTPDKGYQIKEVKVNGSTVTISDSKYTISGIDRNITVEATFEVIPAKTYSLSITATGNGSASYSGTVVRGETGSFTVTEGTSATISFSPDNGYRIKSVKVNGSEVSVSKNQYTISDISGDTTVEVEFEAITYTLSITATGNGSATYNETTIRSKTSDFTVNEGASATISFTPDKGYKIKSVTVNGSKVSLSNNQYTVSNIKKNTTVEVEFEAITYTLSIMATGNGVATYDGTTIRSKTSTFTLNEGASATITFTPDEGNRIKNVKVNNAEVTLSGGQYTVENITSNTKVSVEFEAIPHTLTITAKGNGTASCNGKTVREATGTFEVNEGGSAVITFSPDSGHRIKSVKVNDSEIAITNYLYMIYTVQDITSDTSVEVEFESKTPTTYTLSITATGNGAVSYNGTKVRGRSSSFKVNAGASATISFSPDKGNKVKSVSVNNSDVTSDVSDDSYTIDNISGDTNVKVVFEANAVYKLTYMVDGEVYKVYEIEEGAKITPEPEPKKDGYKFSGWSWIPSKMPAEDVVVTGYFTFDGVVKDDVSYAIEGDNASVTNADNANGEIKIEASVSINGKTYQVTSIAEGAFQGCTGLTSVEIPNSVTTIGQNAFNGCSGLLIIKIGNGVKEIGNKAFANIATNSVTTRAEDTGLKVYCEADVLPSTATDAFENSPIDKGTLIVKDEMVMAYKYAMPWNGFGSIIGITTDIRNIAIDADKAFIFDMQGNRIDNVRKGVNIIRTRDGKTKKVVVK